MAIRRLNYTNRKKLTREEVRVRLQGDGKLEPRVVEVDLNLPSDLPGEARLFIEAHRASPAAMMRFPWGTVASPTPPPVERRRLTEFHDNLPYPFFRVKVTDVTDRPGRLLALADRIAPETPDAQDPRRQGLLPIGWGDNDGLPWKLVMIPAGPQLWIDEHADPGRSFPKLPMFQALVYPEIVWRVIFHALIDDSTESREDPESWIGRWIRFAQEGLEHREELPAHTDLDACEEWALHAAQRFSRKFSFCAALVAAQNEDDD